MNTPREPTITIKIEVPFGSFKKAQEVSREMVEACKKVADHPGKPARIRFVKVES